MTLTLTLPMPENIANGAHGHWSKRHKAKIAYWTDLDRIRAMCAQRGREWRIAAAASPFAIPAQPLVPFAKASIRSTMYLGGAMDDSNAMRRHKWIEDWLKTRGYIKDDRRSCLKWLGFPEQIVKRDGNYRVEITLTPVL